MDLAITNPNLFVINQDYIRLLTSGISGIKCLIFDSETKVMFSLVESKSKAIKEEIFMFEDIDKLKPEEKHLNVKGVFFLRPNEMNLGHLSRILKNPNFAEIYLNFSNQCPDELVKSIANLDEYSSVKNIQEIFLDYYVLNSNLVHLNLESSSVFLFYKNISFWRTFEHTILQRIVDGICGLCLSLRLFPVVKYVRGSESSNLIGQKISTFFQENSQLVTKGCAKNPNGVLFLYDRREDPITPLLSQWTYQAMIHELNTIEQNIVKVKHEKFVLNEFEDTFFKENLNNDFGDVASKIKLKVEKLGKEKPNESLDSIEDIKKFMEQLPDKKRESAEITKHTNIIYDLTDQMESKHLLDISSIEQDIACKDSKKVQLKDIVSIIENKNIQSPLEKIKLYLLFAIRYEQDTNSIGKLKGILEENNMADYVEFADLLLQYAGQTKRQFDLLNNKDFLSKHFNKFQQAFKDIPNVFTQHTTLLSNVVRRLIKGEKVNEVETVNPSRNEKINRMVVFCLGGVTYEEERDMANLRKNMNLDCLVLGGTNVLNSRGFLDQLSLLKSCITTSL